MSTPTLAPVEQAAPTQLTLNDSCDQCGYFHDTNSMGQQYADRISQAFVRVTFPSGHELLLCGHHYAANELALVTVQGVTVDDQRGRLSRA